MKAIEALLASHRDATDIHFTEGAGAMVRAGGVLIPADWAGTLSDLEGYIPQEKRALWGHTGVCDCAFTAGEVRCRLHLYRAGGRKAAAIRILPSLSALPPDGDERWIEAVTACPSGLVLVTGPTGSGKSTTLARMVLCLSERPCHIITIEDPPEYQFPSRAALIHQREIGADTASFSAGVLEALREDPDVVVIGELRDADTMGAALTAAETGRLVLATMHDDSAVGAVGRLVHAFPAGREREVRAVLASVLRYAAAQKIIRLGGRVFLLREILANIPAAASLIRAGKDEQLPSYMEMGRSHMRTMRDAVRGAARAERLTADEERALLAAAGLS